VILRYLEDRSVNDTADILSCAPGTVKALTNQGIGSLRRTLGPLVTEEEPNHA
jgi:DNA-directed RNA polymerase specialized sigma24 family protein